MKVRNWNPKKFDEEFLNVGMGRLRNAAELVAAETKAKLQSRIGSGVRSTGISRPVYKTGPYAGVAWTRRDFGELLKSVRITEKHGQGGHEVYKDRNIRVYVGNYRAYYARIFEFTRPFLRPAWRSSLGKVKAIIGAK